MQLIGTSHRRENDGAAKLYRSLGFRDWQVPWQNPDADEIYLVLHDDPSGRA